MAKKVSERDKEIGTRIMLLRTKKNYSREYVSERAGITSKFLYEIEIKGKSFSTRTLLGLATALEVSADYILLGKGNIMYDQKMANTIGQFNPEALEIVKKLLEAAYELTAFEEEQLDIDILKSEKTKPEQSESEESESEESEPEQSEPDNE